MSFSYLEWAVAGGLAGWAAARLTGADRIRRTEDWSAPLMSFTPQVTAGALAATVMLRNRGPRTTAALAAAALTAAVGPRALRRPLPPAAGPVLRVLTANLFVSRAAADTLPELLAATGADVLFLQELTEAAVGELDRAGLSRLLPHQVLERPPRARGGTASTRATRCAMSGMRSRVRRWRPEATGSPRPGRSAALSCPRGSTSGWPASTLVRPRRSGLSTRPLAGALSWRIWRRLATSVAMFR